MLHNFKQTKHKQSKFFTIMLVPSSSGKTRSVKIPHWMMYAAASCIVVVLGVTTLLYSRSNHFKSVATQINTSLEESEKLYTHLLEESEGLSKKLIDEQKEKELIENMVANEIEAMKQTKEYELEEIKKYYEEKAKELESKIDELEQTKEEIYNKLSSKAYLPEIIKTALWDDAGHNLLAASENTGEQDSVYALLEAKLAVGEDDYEYLLERAEKAKPYLDNYPTIWPVNGKFTSEVGYRQNPLGGTGGEYHSGVDISIANGTDVKATGGGKIKFAGWKNGYGYLVIINHGFGLETYYAHNSKLMVSEGDTISRGDIIAKSGNTGISTGPHVHYEIQLNGNIVNPRDYIFDK